MVQEEEELLLTQEAAGVSRLWTVANHHAGRVNHNLPVTPQSGPHLPGAPTLLQLQSEQVVMAT